MAKKIGRNDPCPCGSGKKYKFCCGKYSQQKSGDSSTATVEEKQLFKFNDSRNSEDVKIFDRYESNPDYQEKFVKLYLDFQKSLDNKTKMDELYSEVCQYAHGRVPDYFGYRELLSKKYLSKTVSNDTVYAGYGFFYPNNKDFNLKQESFDLMLLPLVYAFKTKELDKYKSIDDHSSTQELENFAVAYNAWKIMTSVLSNELGFVLDIIMNMCDEDNLEHLDDDLDKLNSRGLVARFFEAVSKKEKEISFKILGKVKDLDPGEAEYLEAVAYFYDQNYERAIYYGSKVANNNPDYGKTVSLLLESYAIQGKIKELVNLIEVNKSLTFRPLQMLYLIQETVLNTNNFENVIEELTGVDGSRLENISEDTGNEFYEKIALNTCKSIVRLIILIKEAILYSEMDIHIEYLKEEDKYTRNLLALSCVADYFEPIGMKKFLQIIENDISNQDEWVKNLLDTGFECIGKICIDCNPTQSMGLILFALQCQYDIGMKKEFIQNINSNIEALTKYAGMNNRDEKSRNLLLLAYTEELISGEIDETLNAYINTNCQNEINRKSIAQKKLERKFSRNAKIALESAEMMFSMSRDIDWGWRDAGMLSLGFFRIIEVEINDKLILPLIKDDGITELRDSYDVRRSMLTGDDKKTYSSHWGRNIKTLEKISDGSADVDGLMLGELEYFFQNIGISFDSNDNLAVLVRNKLSELMDNNIDIDDLIAMIENEIIKKEIRDKYRNPPAHTKYLPYETACECRDYFYDVMVEFENAIK